MSKYFPKFDPPLTSTNKIRIAVLLAFAGVLLIAVCVVMFSLWSKANTMMTSRFNHAAMMIAERTGWSVFEVKGVVTLLSVPYFYFFSKMGLVNMIASFFGLQVGSPSKFKVQFGWMSALYAGVYWIVLGVVSKDAHAFQYCADTPEGIRYFDVAGGKDPIYGVPTHPCTIDEIKTARSIYIKPPVEVQIKDWRHIEFVNASTGEAQLWYSRRNDGHHFFDRSGLDPESGVKLEKVTQQTIDDYQAAERAREKQALAAAHASQVEAAKRQTSAEDVQVVAHAKSSFDVHNYAAAIQECDSVLGHSRNDDCEQVRHDASVQLAHQYVDEGQRQLQRAHFDDAIRNATLATKLDKDNVPAKTLKQMAETMKQQASTD